MLYVNTLQLSIGCLLSCHLTGKPSRTETSLSQMSPSHVLAGTGQGGARPLGMWAAGYPQGGGSCCCGQSTVPGAGDSCFPLHELGGLQFRSVNVQPFFSSKSSRLEYIQTLEYIMTLIQKHPHATLSTYF